jgi:uncharacterized protein (UPF0333 family)
MLMKKKDNYMKTVTIYQRNKYLTIKEVQNEIACLNPRKASSIARVTNNVTRNVKRRSGTSHIYI